MDKKYIVQFDDFKLYLLCVSWEINPCREDMIKKARGVLFSEKVSH